VDNEAAQKLVKECDGKEDALNVHIAHMKRFCEVKNALIK